MGQGVGGRGRGRHRAGLCGVSGFYIGPLDHMNTANLLLANDHQSPHRESQSVSHLYARGMGWRERAGQD